MYKRSVQNTAIGEHFQIDLVTNLPTSTEGYNCLLLCVCVATHFMIGLPLSDQTSPSISAAVQGIFQMVPNPRFISCDHQEVCLFVAATPWARLVVPVTKLYLGLASHAHMLLAA